MSAPVVNANTYDLQKMQRIFIMEVEGNQIDLGSAFNLPSQTEVPTWTFSSPLTLRMDITKGAFHENFSEGNFTIYNLAESTRKDIYQDWNDQASPLNGYRRIKLWAGYESWVVPPPGPPAPPKLTPGVATNVNSNYKRYLPLIFSGLIRQAYSVREGPNWLTKINAWDGGWEVTKSFTDFTLGSQVPILNKINFLASSINGITMGYIDKAFIAALETYQGKKSIRGTAYSGSAFDLLTDYATAVGADVSIDFGRLNIVMRGNSLPGITQVQTISSSSGLVNTPMKQKFYISWDMIFEPRLILFQELKLDSIETVNNGTYELVGFKHSGIISESVGGNLITTPLCWYGGAI